MLNEKLVKMLVEGELKGIENDVLRQQVINLEKQVKLLKPFAYVGSFVVGYYGTVLVFKTIEHATKRK